MNADCIAHYRARTPKLRSAYFGFQYLRFYTFLLSLSSSSPLCRRSYKWIQCVFLKRSMPFLSRQMQKWAHALALAFALTLTYSMEIHQPKHYFNFHFVRRFFVRYNAHCSAQWRFNIEPSTRWRPKIPEKDERFETEWWMPKTKDWTHVWLLHFFLSLLIYQIQLTISLMVSDGKREMLSLCMKDRFCIPIARNCNRNTF